MIFGILLADWVLAIAFVTAFTWLILYVGFLINLKKPVNVSMYFQAMFKSREKSDLRILWKNLIFALEYLIGLIIAGFIKSAWYPAQWTRKLIGFILFGNNRKDRIRYEKLKEELKDKPKKDNGGVY